MAVATKKKPTEHVWEDDDCDDRTYCTECNASIRTDNDDEMPVVVLTCAQEKARRDEDGNLIDEDLWN